MSDELSKARIVFIGSCQIEGNKPGELWIAEAEARECSTADELCRNSTAFGKGKRSSTVGAIYECVAKLGEGGRLTRLDRNMIYREMLDTDAIRAQALRERGLQDRERAKRAEAKARAAGPCDRVLNQLAEIVAAARPEDWEVVIQGIVGEVRRRALANRAGRR